tara:strand:- start:815 stop:991 length:177 start_codon:yes stop_codon:yes gene_type:complete
VEDLVVACTIVLTLSVLAVPQIFIANNQADEEVSTIDRIQLFGQSKADTNMKEFKKVG